ncbi:MAG TPA: NTP transferase domain-containing protein [Thermoanaerobaculia bacterium]|nr:NTP transferase domain-containing protein [Thermoanaerobaculia bacterium]
MPHEAWGQILRTALHRVGNDVRFRASSTNVWYQTPSRCTTRPLSYSTDGKSSVRRDPRPHPHHLCDQPLITSDHLRTLLATQAPIAATGYNGVAGAPAVFAADLRAELLALHGDRGARAVIETHRDSAAVVPFEEARVDLDTEQDLQAAGLHQRS